MDLTKPVSLSGRAPIGLVGATATGKSAAAIALAERIGGEIVSVDSMQVYRGLDIGTAKPDPADRARVPHHLIDVADLNRPFDVAAFVQLADAAVEQIQRRGRIPLLCGGTGLYLQAFSAGLGSAPASERGLRAELEATPLEQLLEELEHADPTTFNRVDRRNPRRVIRALEVIRLTGRPFSEQRATWPNATDQPIPRLGPVFALVRDGVDLRRRIEVRVDAMFQRGLVQETMNAIDLGLEDNRTACQAIGYRQVLELLRGERDLAQTIALVKNRTWQYARRQMTWFRKHLNPVWIQCASNEPVEGVITRLLDNKELNAEQESCSAGNARAKNTG
jgi:tRNA dimethylallyltransferase